MVLDHQLLDAKQRSFPEHRLESCPLGILDVDLQDVYGRLKRHPNCLRQIKVSQCVSKIGEPTKHVSEIVACKDTSRIFT